jgi:hypothetical protein
LYSGLNRADVLRTILSLKPILLEWTDVNKYHSLHHNSSISILA